MATNELLQNDKRKVHALLITCYSLLKGHSILK
jgi:hypothetical protein